MIETVGVGQSEVEVADVADTVAVIVQPGSGDALQFLKSGIMEVPDVLVVTKADLGDVAMRARRDLAAALRSIGERATQVVAVSSVSPVRGLDELVAALDAHRATLDLRPSAGPSAAPARWPTSPPSTAIAACARSAGPARARRLLDAEPDGADVPSLIAVLEDHAHAR